MLMVGGGIAAFIALLYTDVPQLHRILVVIMIFLLILETRLLPWNTRKMLLMVRWGAFSLFAIYFILHFGLGRLKFRVDFYTLMAGSFLLIGFASAAWASTALVAFYKTLTVLLMFFLAFVGIRGYLVATGDQGMESLATSYSFLTILVMASTVLAFAVDPAIAMSSPNILRGFFNNPNKYATALLLFSPFLYLKYLNPWGKATKKIYLALFLVALAFLCLSFCRAAIGGMLVCAGCYLFVANRRYFPVYIVAVIALSAYFWVASMNNADFIPAGLHDVIYKGRKDIMDPVRSERMETTWNNIKGSPIFGVGFGVSSEKFQDDLLETGTLVAREKGNSYLALMEELGILGFAFVAVMFIRYLTWAYGVIRIGIMRGSKRDPNFLVFLVFFSSTLGLMADAFFEAWLLSAGNFPGLIFWSNMMATLYVGQKVAESSRAAAREESKTEEPVAPSGTAGQFGYSTLLNSGMRSGQAGR